MRKTARHSRRVCDRAAGRGSARVSGCTVRLRALPRSGLGGAAVPTRLDQKAIIQQLAQQRAVVVQQAERVVITCVMVLCARVGCLRGCAAWRERQKEEYTPALSSMAPALTARSGTGGARYDTGHERR